jgi:uncharacterized protein YndB with AHSA1/START domain
MGNRMARTDSASRVVRGSPPAVYGAFVDADTLLAWLPPAGMTARLEAFDPRVGGGYRMTLTYARTDTHSEGKTSSGEDVVHCRFLELVPGERVVQDVQFESDVPAFAGTMRMTWTLAPDPEGTKVTIVCENVPVGIRKEDHDAGLRLSLDNLAALFE